MKDSQTCYVRDQKNVLRDLVDRLQHPHPISPVRITRRIVVDKEQIRRGLKQSWKGM
jgi:hypothetical protein